MKRRSLDFVAVLGLALAIGAACRAQDPDLTELYPKGRLRDAPRRVAPSAHAESHKMVPPPPPTPTPTPFPQTAIGRMGEKIKTLSTFSVGTWTGYRGRGKGTGRADGGLEASITFPSGIKPTCFLGSDGGIGAGLGVSRIFGGAQLSKGRLYGVIAFEPLIW